MDFILIECSQKNNKNKKYERTSLNRIRERKNKKSVEKNKFQPIFITIN